MAAEDYILAIWLIGITALVVWLLHFVGVI